MLAGAVGAAPPFVPPTEANPPFRRDKLPIDTDSMSSLSREMERLSLGASFDKAPQRRAAAQALALAITLDPANTSARSLLSNLAEGKAPNQDPDRLSRAKARVWQFHGWLASPQAGADGNLLADHMGDTASQIDPGHPASAALRDAGERGNWDSWVAPLSEFEETPPVRADLPAEKPRDNPETPPSGQQPAHIALNEAALNTVLYAYDKNQNDSRFRRTQVRMVASEAELDSASQSLRIDIPCREDYQRDVRNFIARPILQALETAGTPIPKNGRITLRAGDGDLYSFRRNTNSISGVGFLLAHAALTGSQPDGTAIGAIDTSGRLVPPAYLWNSVDSLRKSEGGRLVIPAAAEEHFLALLTLEEPEFFLKYEVLIAATPKEFAELIAKNPAEKQASVSTRYQEIREKAPASGLGPYLANRFVRQRLLDIHAEMPQHLSAKMLALQGSAQRPPRTLSRSVLASIIWHAIAPIKDTLDVDPFDINNERIGAMEKAHEEARAALDRLDHLTEREDTELLTHAKSVTSDLRSLTRALRSRTGDWNTRFSSIRKSLSIAKKSNAAMRKELSEITGDPLPENSLEFIRGARGRNRDR
jgi:hypothetical protein